MSFAAGAAALTPESVPAFIRQDAARPSSASGIAFGDVVPGRAIVWSHTDRPARMRVQWATTESFREARSLQGPIARPETGFTARVDLKGLPDGQRVFVRIQFEDLTDARNLSLPIDGNFLSAPGTTRDVAVAWSADTAGQGWGINTSWGGMRMFETIRNARPDFLIHCGDTIYADAPIPAELTLPDGSAWRNLVTPAKSKVAETLGEFRGNFLYNLLDEHVRRFNTVVPSVAVWDDHEFRDNWYPGRSLQDDTRYTVKDPERISAAAKQAFFEHIPVRVEGSSEPSLFRHIPYGPLLDVFALDLRSYRGRNSVNQQDSASAASALAGARQIEWVKTAMARSTATWKVVASSVPLGLLVEDGGTGFDAVGNGSGPPLGREHEIADLLRFIRDRGIRNVVWLTADVHYAAAHYYDPVRAVFKEFRPFWEFVAGPLHGATGVPKRLDPTFGPEVRFISLTPDIAPYVGPWAGHQYFGMVRIERSSRQMAVSLHNLAGDTIYRVTLEPDAAA